MALDETIGGASSDTYATLAEYTAYAAAMGLSLTGDASSQEANLRRARFYIDQAYSWIGTKVTTTQALAWPRLTSHYIDGYSIASDTIPQPIKDAQCEMAVLLQDGATPFITLSSGAVTSQRDKVDVIETETTYSEGSARSRAAYPSVDMLVAEYSTGKKGARSGSVGLSRV